MASTRFLLPMVDMSRQARRYEAAVVIAMCSRCERAISPGCSSFELFFLAGKEPPAWSGSGYALTRLRLSVLWPDKDRRDRRSYV